MRQNKILKKEEKGITLIALVITIIVLLILAGVSIAMLTGENGILTQAKNAKKETERAAEEEERILDEMSKTIEDNISNKKTSKYIAGYWEVWKHKEGATGIDMKLSDVPEGYDIVMLGFAREDESGEGTITFSVNQDSLGDALNYTEENFKEDIQKVKARGQKIVLSIGGAGNPIHITNSSQANNFVSSVTNLIEIYDLDGIDIDIEENTETLETMRDNPKILGDTIRQIRTNSGLGDDFVLTLCGSTESFYSAENPKKSSNDLYYYSPLAKELNDILTFSSIMLYSTGSEWGIYKENGDTRIEVFPGTVEFGPAFVSRIIEEDGVDPSKLTLCYKATNVGNEECYLDPTKIAESLEVLIEGKTITGDRVGPFTPPQAYPNFGGVVIWSINIDAKNSNAIYNSVNNYLNN